MAKNWYDCPCGKKHRSRSTVLTHKKKILKEQSGSEDRVKSDPVNRTAKIKEINLKPEFDKLVTKVNPKKKDEDKEYECGECGGVFSEKLKHCPHCGVEFE